MSKSPQNPPLTRPANSNTEHADSPLRKRPRLDQDATNTDIVSTTSSQPKLAAISDTSDSEDLVETTGSIDEPLSAGLKLADVGGIILNLRDPPNVSASSHLDSVVDAEAASVDMTASQDNQVSDEGLSNSQIRDASMSPEIRLVGEGEESDVTVVDDYEDIDELDEDIGDDPLIDLDVEMSKFPLAGDGNLVEAVRRFTKLIADGESMLYRRISGILTATIRQAVRRRI
jgi:hypothetical protein